jgi:hypothetical protein
MEFKFTKILCNECNHFEDTGLRTFIQYDKSRRFIKGRVQVRFYCHGYMEYLQKLYSRCLKFAP